MRKIIYYVASSIDGYISGMDDDISGFAHESSGVNKYLNDLKKFDTVLMGRNTYEFGYKFGLKPGEVPYPHMVHYIFSDTLKLEPIDSKLNICKLELAFIQQLKGEMGTDIYLCGGGQLAGWLLELELIDQVKIKLNPLILGKGIKLFENLNKQYKLNLMESEAHSHGLHILSYDVVY